MMTREDRAATTARPPLLERAGVGYFRRRRLPPVPAQGVDAIHHLNADERRALRRIQQGAVARAALAGAISASIVGVFDTFILDPERQAAYWVSLGLVAATLAVLEIGFLYWDSLRSVHDLSHAAGLELFGDGKAAREAVAAALARAALELPNPPQRIFGVDPRREVKKLRLVAVAVLYKAKIGLTNFLIRALLRRALGRAAARGLLSFVAVPVSALWNGLVAYRVQREARIRVLGPSAVEEMCEIIFAAAGALGPLGRDTAVRAVGSSIVRTRDMHPNLRHLLVHVSEALRADPEPDGDGDGQGDVDDPARFLDQLERLPEPEQLTALRILNVASIIDGRLTVAERALVKEALLRTGRPPTSRYVRKLRRAFLDGDVIAPEMVLEVSE
jgi:hypothetical protein